MRRPLLLVGIVVISLCFCKKGKPDKVVAQVGKTALTVSEFNAQIPKDYTLSPEQRVDLLDKWVNSELLYQEAHRQGLEKNDTVKARLRQLTKEYVVNEFIQRETAKVSISRHEMFDYFNKYKNDFLHQVKILQILLPDEVSAQRTLDEIKAGADFKKLAAERSLDRLTARGQESNYFGRGTGDPTLEEQVFSLAVGAVSPVIKAPDGFHIVKLVDKKQVKKDVTFEEMAEYIYSVLYYKKSREVVENLLAEIKKKQKVETHPEAFAQ